MHRRPTTFHFRRGCGFRVQQLRPGLTRTTIASSLASPKQTPFSARNKRLYMAQQGTGALADARSGIYHTGLRLNPSAPRPDAPGQRCQDAADVAAESLQKV